MAVVVDLVVVGLAVVGLAVVGLAVVGLAVVGLAVVGLAVVFGVAVFGSVVTFGASVVVVFVWHVLHVTGHCSLYLDNEHKSSTISCER